MDHFHYRDGALFAEDVCFRHRCSIWHALFRLLQSNAYKTLPRLRRLTHRYPALNLLWHESEFQPRGIANIGTRRGGV